MNGEENDLDTIQKKQLLEADNIRFWDAAVMPSRYS